MPADALDILRRAESGKTELIASGKEQHLASRPSGRYSPTAGPLPGPDQ